VSTMTDFEETAERIIRLEGLIFALACSAGGSDVDLSKARDSLKRAITRALEDAIEMGELIANPPEKKP
jgi:hypothetical protein